MDDENYKGTIADVSDIFSTAMQSLTGDILTADLILFTLGDRMAAYSLKNSGVKQKKYSSCLAQTYLDRNLKESRYVH